MSDELVFISDESGMGGEARLIGAAFWDVDCGGWYVQENAFVARPATDEEIRETKRFNRTSRERTPDGE